MNIKIIADRLYSLISVVIAIVILGAIIIGTREYLKPSSFYFVHYGNITMKDVFVAPEEIEVYTFGIDNESGPVNITNQLWCVSADSVSRQWVLFGTQYRSSESLDLLNVLPPGLQFMPVSKDRPSSIGVANRKQILAMDVGEHSLIHWSFGDIVPHATSSCYVHTEAIAKTEFFKLTKSVEYKSVEFSYIVETDVIDK